MLLVGVETVGRFIEDEHLRVVDDRLRETGAMAVTFREGVDALVADRLEEGRLDGLVDCRLDFRSGDAAHLGGEAEEGLHRHVRVERRGLGEVANLRLGFDFVFLDVGPADADGALRRGEITGDHAHGRGLAGAVGTEKSEDLALLDDEGDPVDRHLGTEVFMEIFDFYHG